MQHFFLEIQQPCSNLFLFTVTVLKQKKILPGKTLLLFVAHII